MPIRYYEGVEGSGKSCMMSRDLYLHYMSGGRVAAFPGYDLYDFDGETISERLMPEDWVTLPEDLKQSKLVIAIDEVTSFFNNHTWYNKMNDMMQSLMAQRRKYEAAIVMTGPFIKKLPPDLQDMIHEVVHCQDNHTLNHKVPRGEQCIYYKEDRRGLLSRPTQRYTKRRVFLMKNWYPIYDTYAAIDAREQFNKVKVLGRTITIGPDGQIIEPQEVTPFDPEAAGGIIQPSAIDPREEKVIEVLRYLKGMDIHTVELSVMLDLLGVKSLIGRGNEGTMLKKYGAAYNPIKKFYKLDGVPSDI